MIIGKVVGSVWATRKDEKLKGLKLMIVEPFNKKSGETMQFVAADNVGAGVSDLVLITKGSSARKSIDYNEDTPVDAVIVGIIDQIEIEDREF